MQVGRDQKTKRAPEAEALGARLLATLRQHLSGCGASLCGDRSADYFSKALRGEPGRVLTVTRDLAQLATRPEKEARAAIHGLALELLDAVRPTDGTLLGEALAVISREFGELVGEHAKAVEDGKVSADECDRLLREVADQQRALTTYAAALQGHRRRLSA